MKIGVKRKLKVRIVFLMQVILTLAKPFSPKRQERESEKKKRKEREEGRRKREKREKWRKHVRLCVVFYLSRHD